jgi:acetyl-CoA synthetase
VTTPDDQVAAWLAEYGSPTANAAAILCDLHPPDAPAFTIVEADMSALVLSYGELADRSKRLAAVLQGHGVTVRDRVAVLMGKRADLIVTLLALWRLGAVQVPLFTAFATGAIQQRAEAARAKLIITEHSQRAKVEAIDGVEAHDVDDLMAEADNRAPLSESVAVGGDGVIIQHYTSGTTGKPKGVPVPLQALANFRSYLHYTLDVRSDDVYWCSADPGWAYGLFFAIVGPMLLGQPGILFNSGFTPESTFAVLREFGVTNFTGAPTMFRAMRLHPEEQHVTLRCASSAGEPLTPDIIEWARDALGTDVRDTYGQTEIGIVISNHWNPDVAKPIRPGSIGQPMPGIAAGIVDGQIAIDVAHSPLLWFRGYHENPEKTAERFSADGAWYLTADLGYVDEDCYFYFTARDDDLIMAAGYRIGPYDVESVMQTHPAVAEVAVVGRPDPEGIRGEVVTAFVVPRPGVETGPELERELQAHVRDNYSKHAYPRAVHFVYALPKTPTGKVQRYLLKQQ